MRVEHLAAINQERAARRPVALVTDLETGDQKLVFERDFLTDPLAEAMASRLGLRQSGLISWNGRNLLFTLLTPPTRLVIVGAVRIAQALAGIAALAGFSTTVIDPRLAFATPARFPHVDLVAEWPDTAFEKIGLDPHTAVACLTHDPKIDDPALALALQAGCFYVGALGSRGSHNARLKRLRARGFDDETLVRIKAPIGLDIGATGPTEIAISILAELTLVSRRKPLRSETPVTAPTNPVTVMQGYLEETRAQQGELLTV
jgi:xanthine dehydrogenase accessory factor